MYRSIHGADIALVIINVPKYTVANMACNLRSIQQDVSAALVASTRVATEISKEDLDFHRNSDPTVISLLEQQNTRLLDNARRLAKAALSGTKILPPQLLSVDMIEDHWSRFTDLFDNLLEKADTCLDEFTGSIKNATTDLEHLSRIAASASGKQKIDKVYRAAVIPKPQLLFSVISMNHSKEPFKPLLTDKPHAKIPLTDCLDPAGFGDSAKQYEAH